MTNKFGKVAVLMGGWSAERAVSLKSGKAVLDALVSQGVNAVGIDVGRDIASQLKGFDRVFNILHGRGGEDGQIQGLLDILQIPYTGSGILGSAIGMDKLLTKQIWLSNDLPTPQFSLLESDADCAEAIVKLGLPLMVKPALEGSSIGISKVKHADEMLAAFQAACACGGPVIAEKFIKGGEYTCAILGERVLPMIRLETTHEFYDYNAKYLADDTRYICPCGLPAAREAELGQIMLKAFRAAHARGWGRVDFMLDEQGQPWLIEINTVPGMTDHSLVPMAARQAGISFEQLVITILQETLH
ncbi:MAG: D-alanine-D-alanine ligase [Pseudomonadota bacterium]|nr:D-alanine-D-alanine ligase [Pseudomonadota bacterium]